MLDTMNHKHIPIRNGYITWHGKKNPTKKQMEAFNALYDAVEKKIDMETKLNLK